MAKIKIIGDSVLKGTLYNSETDGFTFHNYLEAIPDSENLSKFGCTVTKGADYIYKVLEKDSSCEYLLMNFGGNDSDYPWKEISDAPLEKHSPKTPVEIFVSTYVELLKRIKSYGIKPVITTLTPIYNIGYFNYLCKTFKCDPVQIMIWLKDISRLGDNQQRYSEIVKQIAEQEGVPLIDLRKAFMAFPDYTKLLCDDGIHPNKDGQMVILNSIIEFFKI